MLGMRFPRLHIHKHYLVYTLYKSFLLFDEKHTILLYINTALSAHVKLIAICFSKQLRFMSEENIVLDGRIHLLYSYSIGSYFKG